MSVLFSLVFAAVSVVSYDGTSVSPGDAVQLTVGDDGAISSLVAAPVDGGTVVVEGAGMTFAAGAVCRFSAPGTLIFSNDVVSAGMLTAGEDDEDAEISYSGAIVSSTGYTTMFPGRRLSDYDVKSSYFKKPNGCEGYDLIIGHQGDASPECVIRGKTADGSERMRVLLQKWRDPHLSSVQLELVQQGEDIAGKVLSACYSTVNLLGVDVHKLFAERAMLRKGVNLVREQNVADPSRNFTGYAVNQLTMARRTPSCTVVFAGGALGLSDMTVAKGTHVLFSDQSTSVGKFSGGGTLAFSAARPQNATYGGFIPVNTVFTLAENCSLSRLSSMTGELRVRHKDVYSSGSGKTESAVAYDLEPVPGDTDGWYRCQFQCLVNGYICCVRMRLRQNGADIEAKSENTYGNFMLQSDGKSPSCGLGHDFYVATGTGTGLYANGTSWGMSLSDITLGFRQCETVITNSNQMTSMRMTIGGATGYPATNLVRVTHIDGLGYGQTVVGANGILDIDAANAEVNGSGIGRGNSLIVVLTNGLLRACKRNVLSTYGQKMRIYGGGCKFGHGLVQTADNSLGAGDLLLCDGARLFGSPPRVGFQTTSPIWRVTGSLPSVCDCGAFVMKNVNESEPTIFNLYVEDVTEDGDADFIINGSLRLFEDDRRFDDVTLCKLGDGTVLQNGTSGLVSPTHVCRGAWMFGRSGVSLGAQEFILEGDTVLALGAGVSNGLSRVTVNASATIDLAEGSLLALDDIQIASGAKLMLEGDFGAGVRSVRVSNTLPSSTLAYVRCADGRVSQDEEGYLRPMPKVFYMTIR